MPGQRRGGLTPKEYQNYMKHDASAAQRSLYALEHINQIVLDAAERDRTLSMPEIKWISRHLSWIITHNNATVELLYVAINRSMQTVDYNDPSKHAYNKVCMQLANQAMLLSNVDQEYTIYDWSIEDEGLPEEWVEVEQFERNGSRTVAYEERLDELVNLRTQLLENYTQVKTSSEQVDVFESSDWALYSNFDVISNADFVFIRETLYPRLRAIAGDDFYKSEQNWPLILVSSDVEARAKLIQHVSNQSSDVKRRFAKITQHAVSYLQDGNKDVELQYQLKEAQETMLLEAAVEGDRYSMLKAKRLADEDTSLQDSLEAIRLEHEKLNNHISLLKEALAHPQYKYAFLGKSNRIQWEIIKLEDRRDKLVEASKRWLSARNSLEYTIQNEEANDYQAMMQELDKKHMKSIAQLNAHYHDTFVKRKKTSRVLDLIKNVVFLGVPYLYRKLQAKIGNLVVDSSVVKGSAFKYWHENYDLIVDAMDGDVTGMVAENARLERLKEKYEEEKENIEDEIAELQEDLSLLSKSAFAPRAIRRERAAIKKELKALNKKLAKVNKDLYRVSRNRKALYVNSHLSQMYPGLEIAEKPVVTKDGKHLDVLVITNKVAAQKNPEKDVPDVVFFSGSGCAYYLEDRHFELAMARGCNVVVVQDRYKSAHSRADVVNRKGLALDGEAAVNSLIEMRTKEYQEKGKEYNVEDNLVIHGYCGGGPIALLTHEAMKKQGKNLKFIGDRTFDKTSNIVKSFVEAPVAEKTWRNAPIRFGYAALKLLATPLVLFANWETDNAKRLAQIDEHQRMHFNVGAPKAHGENRFEDVTISKQAELHKGMDKVRSLKKNQLKAYKAKLLAQKEAFFAQDNDGLGEEEQVEILRAFDNLIDTINYMQKSYTASKVISTVDDAHRAPSKHLVMRDNVMLDEVMLDFVHRPTNRAKQEFTPLMVQADDPNYDLFRGLWVESHKIFEDFQQHGQRMENLGHRDHDIRIRINELFGQINATHANKRHQERHGEALGLKQAIVPKLSPEFERFARAEQPVQARPQIVIQGVLNVRSQREEGDAVAPAPMPRGSKPRG